MGDCLTNEPRIAPKSRVKEEEEEVRGGVDVSCINMTTFCQRFLPGTSILTIKQFAQIVAMILYQLLSQRKSPGQIAHTPRSTCFPAAPVSLPLFLSLSLWVRNQFLALEKGFRQKAFICPVGAIYPRMPCSGLGTHDFAT